MMKTSKLLIVLVSASVLAVSQTKNKLNVMSASEILSIRMNSPQDSVLISNFYGYFWKWNRFSPKDSIPSDIAEYIRAGNFCVTNIVHVNWTLRLLVLEIGAGKEPQVMNILSHLTGDSNIQSAFNPIARLRDSFFIVTLTNHNGIPLLSSRYIQQAYTDLEFHSIGSGSDTLALFYYILNQSSLGGDYANEHLHIISAQDNTLSLIFDKTIVDVKSYPEDTDYHYIYDISPSNLIMLRIDKKNNKETVEKYRFTGNNYVLVR
jgi:hypothetical protein